MAVGGERIAPESVLARAGAGPKNVGHARTYKVTRADAGHPVVCTLTASNDGGISTAAFAPTSMVKIPR